MIQQHLANVSGNFYALQFPILKLIGAVCFCPRTDTSTRNVKSFNHDQLFLPPGSNLPGTLVCLDGLQNEHRVCQCPFQTRLLHTLLVLCLKANSSIFTLFKVIEMAMIVRSRYAFRFKDIGKFNLVLCKAVHNTTRIAKILLDIIYNMFFGMLFILWNYIVLQIVPIASRLKYNWFNQF